MGFVRDSIEKGCSKLGVEVTTSGYNQLEIYYSELKKWSKKVNLIARESSDKQIVENHFLDSMSLVPYLFSGEAIKIDPDSDYGSNIHLVDIGTGAGFPGLVCKIVCPGLKLTLIEPRLKRVNFLHHIIRSLGLDGVAVVHGRVDETGGSSIQFPSKPTHITGRAVAGLVEFIRMADYLALEEVILLVMKGPRWREELKNAGPVIQESSFYLKKDIEFVLPLSKAERAILIFEN